MFEANLKLLRCFNSEMESSLHLVFDGPMDYDNQRIAFAIVVVVAIVVVIVAIVVVVVVVVVAVVLGVIIVVAIAVAVVVVRCLTLSARNLSETSACSG